MDFNCSVFSHLIQFLYGNPHFYSSSYLIPPTNSNSCLIRLYFAHHKYQKASGKLMELLIVPVSQCPSFSMKRINFPNRAAIASTSVTPHLNSKSSFWNELQKLLCDIHHIVLAMRKTKSQQIQLFHFISSTSLWAHTKQLTTCMVKPYRLDDKAQLWPRKLWNIPSQEFLLLHTAFHALKISIKIMSQLQWTLLSYGAYETSI